MLVYRAQNDDNDGNESNGNDVGCGDDELIAQPSTPNDERVNDEVMYEGEGNEVDGGDENEEGDAHIEEEKVEPVQLRYT